MPAILAPVIRPPRHPVLLARFGLPALLPATALARLAFRRAAARALFAGMAAHSMLRLGQPMSASFGLVLGLLAHAVGWPMARGGSGAIAEALEAEARSLGVEIVTGHRVDALADLPPARAYLLDVTPRQVLAMAGDRLPAGYRRQLEGFRYGPGVFKIDWALDGPIPWTRSGDAPGRRRSTSAARYREIAASEDAVGRGRHAGAAVRPPRAAHDRRSVTGARGQARRLGVLPRPQRLHRGHDGGHRGPGRALRARLPGPGPGPRHEGLGRDGGLRRELRRRRHQRRHR